MRVASNHNADADGTRTSATMFAGALLIQTLPPPLPLSSVESYLIMVVTVAIRINRHDDLPVTLPFFVLREFLGGLSHARFRMMAS